MDAVNVIGAIVEVAEQEEAAQVVEVEQAVGLVEEQVVEAEQAVAEQVVAARAVGLVAQAEEAVERAEEVVADQHGVILVKMVGNAFRPSLRCLLLM